MDATGVRYHVGREASRVYGETWNGVRTAVKHHGHWLNQPVDPYVRPGDPSSGLLPRINVCPPGNAGMVMRGFRPIAFAGASHA